MGGKEMKPCENSEIAKAEINDNTSNILIEINATPCGSQLKLQQSKTLRNKEVNCIFFSHLAMCKWRTRRVKCRV